MEYATGSRQNCRLRPWLGGGLVVAALLAGALTLTGSVRSLRLRLSAMSTWTPLLASYVERRRAGRGPPLAPARPIATSAHNYDDCSLFKNDPGGHSAQEHGILEALFEEVDAYCADPAVRSETVDGIGDEELLDAARLALNELGD